MSAVANPALSEAAEAKTINAKTINEGAVELRSVCKDFGDRWERQMVLEDLNLSIEPGLLTAVVGPSGCGKSTLVNLIAGFEKPDSGQLLFDGKPITKPSHERIVVFQETALMPWLTTYSNTVFGPKLRGEMKGSRLREAAGQLLAKVGLTEFKDKYPIQLSGGMQRRAELARALINSPKLLIMDEPFRGLDAMTRELMQEFFLRLFEEYHRTNLFVTSEIEEAVFLADRLVILSNRPTKVRTVIDIDLPRPRQFQMMGSSEAFAYKREAMEILHEEAMKSFQGQAGSQSDFLAAYSQREGS